MIEVSEYLISVLSAYPKLTAAVQDKIYPLVANEDVSFPFAVYAFDNVPYASKDASAYDVNIAVWYEPNNVMEAYQMADDLKALAEQNPWEFQSFNVGFDPGTQKIFSEINFKIIM